MIKRTVDEQMAIGIEMELRSRGGTVEDYTMVAYGGMDRSTRAASPPGWYLPHPLPTLRVCLLRAWRRQPQAAATFTNAAPMPALDDPITRSLFDEYERLNGYIEELERRGREDLVRQGYASDEVKHRLNWTCAMETSL